MVSPRKGKALEKLKRRDFGVKPSRGELQIQFND